MIHIEQVSKSYNKGKVKALDLINLHIKGGTLFGLIGPDGAGKTSLIRIIASLLLQDAGTVRVFDHNTTTAYKEVRRIIGYMPGRFSLYQDLSVEENLDFFATVFNVSREKNYDLIKDLYIQLEPFKDRRAGKLSGGMKQKLALCCALIHEPQLLLLDEPTTGVDPVSRKEFWEMLIRLKEKGITIVVSTPYMDEAALCDQIALIQSGKILEQGSPQQICIQAGMSLYRLKLPQVNRYLQLVKAYPNLKSCYSFGDELHVHMDEQWLNHFKSFMEQQGMLGYRIEKMSAGIEDVFMAKLSQ